MMENKDHRKISDNIIYEIWLEAINEKYPHSHQVIWLCNHIEYLLEIKKAQENELFKLRNRVRDQSLNDLT